MIGDNGNAPDHAQDGHQLISAAQRARTAFGQDMSPADREAVFRSAPPILDDSHITPPSCPQQSVERGATPPMSSFDLWDNAR